MWSAYASKFTSSSSTTTSSTSSPAAAAPPTPSSPLSSSSSSHPPPSSPSTPPTPPSSRLSSLLPSFLNHLTTPSSTRAAAKNTFVPLTSHTTNKRISLHRCSQATLATGITRDAVRCPPTEDPDEWLAVHTVDAYNEVSLLYGVIHNHCLPSNEKCEVMNGGPEYEYLWADPQNELYKKPTKVSAKEYVLLLLSWVEAHLKNPLLFPPSTSTPFPRTFKTTVSKIFTRLFRVYAHTYLVHLPDMERAGAVSHLNSCFKHFYFVASEFNLIEEREQVPLSVLIRTICAEEEKRERVERRRRVGVNGGGLGGQQHLARLQRIHSQNSERGAGGSGLRPGGGKEVMVDGGGGARKAVASLPSSLSSSEKKKRPTHHRPTSSIGSSRSTSASITSTTSTTSSGTRGGGNGGDRRPSDAKVRSTKVTSGSTSSSSPSPSSFSSSPLAMALSSLRFN